MGRAIGPSRITTPLLKLPLTKFVIEVNIKLHIYIDFGKYNLQERVVTMVIRVMIKFKAVAQ
jgi:hypothetical protein